MIWIFFGKLPSLSLFFRNPIYYMRINMWVQLLSPKTSFCASFCNLGKLDSEVGEKVFRIGEISYLLRKSPASAAYLLEAGGFT